jgi:hypothetical protein
LNELDQESIFEPEKQPIIEGGEVLETGDGSSQINSSTIVKDNESVTTGGNSDELSTKINSEGKNSSSASYGNTQPSPA